MTDSDKAECRETGTCLVYRGFSATYEKTEHLKGRGVEFLR